MLGLTTKSWHDELLTIDDEAWLDGGTPEPSRIIHWSVDTLEHSYVDFWQGRLDETVIDEAVDQLIGYL